MIQDKVKTIFSKHHNLKVLFFFDSSKDYSEDIKNWELPTIELIIADQGFFKIKYQLEFILPEKKAFIYFPHSKPEKFALLDILKANRELLIDDVADFMEDYGLQSFQRNLVKKYIKELKLKKVQRVLSKILNPTQFEERTIVQGLISYYLDLNQSVDSTLCLAKIFCLALPENALELSLFNQRLKKIEAEERVKGWFNQFFDFSVSDLNSDQIASAVRKLKYNLLTSEITQLSEEDPYQKLKIDKPNIVNRMQSFLLDWQNNILAESIDLVFNKLGGDVKEEKILKIYGYDREYGFYTNKLAFQIFEKIISIIDHQPEQASKLLQNLVNRNGRKEELNRIIELFFHTANFYKQINSITSFILNKPEEYVENYANKYGKIDYHHRKASLLLKKLDGYDFPDGFSLEEFKDKLHQTYEDYLKELSIQWLKCLQERSFHLKTFKIDKQYNFYEKFIRKSDQKTVVIISDALRYEAASQLMDEIHSDSKSQVMISYMVTALPSNTSFGMANLLPNKGINLKGNEFFIENISTEGLINRQKILQLFEKDSRAIQYSELEKIDQADARELFKSKLVYIYHNVIDAIGDDRKTETDVYTAVDRAIEDLKIIIKKIHSSWNVSRVLVTADHGFIYNQRKLPEAMYENLPKENEIVLAHNRFCIIKNSGNTSSYKFNLKDVSNVDSDAQVLIPKAINRFKRQGSGVHFVHGGATLQEIIVPVLESTRKREEVSQKVDFSILNKELLILSGAIKLRILQNDPIGKSIKARSILIGLYDSSSQLISNETDLELDSTSETPTGRTKEVILNLSNKAGRIAICYLQIFDKQDDKDKLNPLFKQKVINKTLIETDF